EDVGAQDDAAAHRNVDVPLDNEIDGARGHAARSLGCGRVVAGPLRPADVDLVALDAHGVHLHRLLRGRVDDLAGADVEAAEVPGTGDDVTLQVAVREWAAVVRALVREGEERAVDVRDRDPLAVDVHQLEPPARNLVRLRNLYEISCHRQTPPPAPPSAP